MMVRPKDGKSGGEIRLTERAACAG